MPRSTSVLELNRWRSLRFALTVLDLLLLPPLTKGQGGFIHQNKNHSVHLSGLLLLAPITLRERFANNRGRLMTKY
jgi:hypothetical protein